MMTTAFSENTLALDFFPLESIGLHHVAGLEVLPTLEADAALLAGRHLAHIFLEVLEGADPALEELLLASEKLDPASTADLALHDAATGDDADARDLDRGDDLDLAFADLTVRRLAQALGRALDVLCQLVDDVVVADLDLGALGRGGAGRRWLQVEADDDGAGNAREQKVRVADRPHALTDGLDRDHRVLDLLERREHSLQRALGVGFDDQAELLDLAFLRAAGQVLEGDPRREVARRLLGTLLGQLGQGDLAGRLLRADDLEDIAGLRHLAHAGHHDWRRRRRLGDAPPAVISQRSHPPVDMAAHEVVTDPQRAGLDEHRGDRAAAALEVGVDDRPDRVAVGVGLQLEDVGRQHDRGQQVVDTPARLGAQVHALVLAAVMPRHDALLGEL